MSKSMSIALAMIIIGAGLLTLTGCSKSASSESDVTIKVVSGGASSSSTYMAVYESDEMEDYTRHSDGTLSIYLKGGRKIETSMFTIETKH